MSRQRFVIVLFSIVLTCFYGAVSVQAEENPIILGVSNAQSGPAGQLGTRLNQGANVYFNKVNRTGGVLGRQIKLLTLDDGYEPFKTVLNTQSLLKTQNLFALFNYVGTPTTKAAMPFIKNSNLPFLMPFTGAEFLRLDNQTHIVNLRASYYQEAQEQIAYLVQEQKKKKIGLLIQADAFGLDVEKGYNKSLEAYGLKPVVSTRYRRNTEDIKLALTLLNEHQVEAIAFVGTYKPLAEFIERANKINFTPIYATVSFVSSHELFLRLTKKNVNNVLVTEVLPPPNTCRSSICLQFIKDMQQAGITEPDQIQFEGYLNARAFTESAITCGTPLTQKCVLKHLKSNAIRYFDVDQNSDAKDLNQAKVYRHFLNE